MVYDNLKQYNKDHQYCPECGFNNNTQTLLSFVWHADVYRDTNRVNCFCGWIGIVDELKPGDELKPRKQMKFLKYHHKWAWGNSATQFSVLGESNEIDKELIKDVCESLVDAHSYSDKYRGISYDVIDISELTKEEKKILITEYEYKIRRDEESVNYFIELITELKSN